jgi:hypothetical protein
MSTDSENRHHKAWVARRKEDGWKKLSIWLTPELAHQVERYASREMMPQATVIEVILKDALLKT